MTASNFSPATCKIQLITCETHILQLLGGVGVDLSARNYPGPAAILHSINPSLSEEKWDLIDGYKKVVAETRKL